MNSISGSNRLEIQILATALAWFFLCVCKYKVFAYSAHIVKTKPNTIVLVCFGMISTYGIEKYPDLRKNIETKTVTHKTSSIYTTISIVKF